MPEAQNFLIPPRSKQEIFVKKGSGEALISWCSPIDYASSIYEVKL